MSRRQVAHTSFRGRRGPQDLSVLRDERQAREHLNHRFYAAQEQKLGRPLTDAERRIDIVEILSALEKGKERLHKAILKEQRRVADLAARGRPGEMVVGDEMVAALNELNLLGNREARRELARIGVKPGRQMARPRTQAVRRLIARLTGHLPSISVRVRRRAVQLQLDQESHRAILTAASQIPGALDAASRLVSGAYYSGMGDVFSASADAVASWQYTAVLDGGTCDSCESLDGTEYATWEDAQDDMPDGGPNPECFGDGRCRCRLVPTGPADLGPPLDDGGPAPPDEPLDATVTDASAVAKIEDLAANLPDTEAGNMIRGIVTGPPPEASSFRNVARDASGNLTGAIDFQVNDDGVYVMGIGSVQKGVGSKLMEEPIWQARVRGVPVELETTPAAVGFYERLGFKLVDDGPLMRLEPTPLPGPADRIAADLKAARANPDIVDRATGERTLDYPSGTMPGIVKTDDPAVAAQAIENGKQVELGSTKDITTLLDKLAQIANDAKEKGGGTYDLGKVSVKGTNLFTRESLGIPRAQMPQLSGVPLPGSKAAALAPNARGEVDVTGRFIQQLKDSGVQVDEADVKASALKATQSELDGEKVSGIMHYLEDGGKLEGRITVTNDNYVVDGHHRWAAEVGLDYKGGTDAGMTIPVERIYQPIQTVLNEANAFAKEWGIPQQSINDGRKIVARQVASKIVANTREAKPVIDLLKKDGRFVVTNTPPASQAAAVRRAAQVAADLMPTATEVEVENFVDRVIVEEREGLVPRIEDIAKDYFVAAEWDMALVESDLLGARAFLTKENGKFKLILQGKDGKKLTAIDDAGDFLKKVHQGGGGVTVSQPTSPDAAAFQAVPEGFMSADVVNAVLEEPTSGINFNYFGVAANPDGSGRFVGCAREFEDHGRFRIQTCRADGSWSDLPPPPMTDMAMLVPIDRLAAASVAIRTLASGSITRK